MRREARTVAKFMNRTNPSHAPPTREPERREGRSSGGFIQPGRSDRVDGLDGARRRLAVPDVGAALQDSPRGLRVLGLEARIHSGRRQAMQRRAMMGTRSAPGTVVQRVDPTAESASELDRKITYLAMLVTSAKTATPANRGDRYERAKDFLVPLLGVAAGLEGTAYVRILRSRLERLRSRLDDWAVRKGLRHRTEALDILRAMDEDDTEDESEGRYMRDMETRFDVSRVPL